SKQLASWLSSSGPRTPSLGPRRPRSCAARVLLWWLPSCGSLPAVALRIRAFAVPLATVARNVADVLPDSAAYLGFQFVAERRAVAGRRVWVAGLLEVVLGE